MSSCFNARRTLFMIPGNTGLFFNNFRHSCRVPGRYMYRVHVPLPTRQGPGIPGTAYVPPCYFNRGRPIKNWSSRPCTFLHFSIVLALFDRRSSENELRPCRIGRVVVIQQERARSGGPIFYWSTRVVDRRYALDRVPGTRVQVPGTGAALATKRYMYPRPQPGFGPFPLTPN